MKKRILYLFLAGLACLPFAPLCSQTLYQDAMALHEFRQLLKAFDQAHQNKGNQLLVPSDSATMRAVDPSIRPCLQAMCKTGSTARKPFSNSFGDDAAEESNILMGDSLVRQQQAIHAFYVLEKYVRGSDPKAARNAIVAPETAALTSDPAVLDFLPQINQQLKGGSRAAIPEALPTAGALDLLTGGIPEAAIIQGIVDWTVERAKEELMRAFLQNWLDKLEHDPVLQVAFPKSLDLLATTDLTTIISQGGVWKAAFEQDLQNVPAHLPALLQAILARVPAGHVPAPVRTQLLGAARVASALYVPLQQKQKLSTAILTASQSLLQSGQAPYSYAERGLFATQVLLNAVQVEQAGALKVLQPQAIQDLSPSQFDELWNLLVAQEMDALKAITGLSDSTISAKLNALKAKLKAALLDVAAIAGTLQQIRMDNTADNKGSDEDRFQSAAAYFGLVASLLDEGLDLVAIVENDSALQKTVDQLIRPLGHDLAGIAEGISTKQYGMVVTNLIAAIRLIGAEAIQNQEDKDLLRAAAAGIEIAAQLRTEIKTETDPKALVNSVSESFAAFADSVKAIDGGKLAHQVDSLANLAKQIAETELKHVKNELEKHVKAFTQLLQDRVGQIDLGNGLDDVAEQFNTYGRFMVNVLTAETSDDVKEAFEDAAMKTGSYMVKQTSLTSLTVTFLPGFSVGREWAGKASEAGALSPTATYMGMSLPIGMEFSFAPSKIGTWGVYAQVLDLGAVMNFRLSQTPLTDTTGVDTVTTTSISPEIGFRQVLSPGLALLYHVPKAPIVIGARASYAPLLRNVNENGSPVLQTSMWQVGGFIAVDVTAFQLFASRKKRHIDWQRIGE
jgi:hypothetical protein